MNKVKRFIMLSTVVILWSCQDNKSIEAKEEVTFYPTLSIKEQSSIVYSDYPVVLQGKKDVELRPKIDGFIESILVDEGQQVKKGQVLFKLYAPQFKEENTAAIASLNRAESELKQAKMQVKKAMPLVKENIISSYELESAEYNLKSKEAQLLQARANLSNAGANVGYTQIVAPFDGVIGLIPYKEGALVSSNSIEPLTLISDISSIHTYISMNEKEFFDFMQQAKGTNIKEKIASLPDVSLLLANGDEYISKGKINTVSGQIDPLTGSISFRAVFENRQGLLRSGNSAIIRLYEQVEKAMLVPQKATYDLQGKHFVYLVQKDGRVKSKEVKLMEKEPSSTHYIILSGLHIGDRIVSEDIGGLKDGVQIKL